MEKTASLVSLGSPSVSSCTLTRQLVDGKLGTVIPGGGSRGAHANEGGIQEAESKRERRIIRLPSITDPDSDAFGQLNFKSDCQAAIVREQEKCARSSRWITDPQRGS